MPRLAQAGGALGPAEHLLDVLAEFLTGLVAGVAGGAPIERRSLTKSPTS